MIIIYQTDKISGITCSYENQSFWDSELKSSKSKRELIVRVDHEVKEIIPTDGIRKKRSPSYVSYNSELSYKRANKKTG